MEWIAQKNSFMLQFPFKVKHFFTFPKLAYIYIYISKWEIKEKHVLYIACEMKFKEKTYGLNLYLHFSFELKYN